MDRRNALQQLGVLALLASPIGFSLGRPERAKPQENFQILKSAVPVSTADKIEVLEFFHYGCSHCHDFEPLVARWVERLPNDVAFIRVPAVWGKPLEALARLHYTLLATKRLDLHATIFAAVQEQRLRLDTPDGVSEWAKKNKLDVSAFMDIYRSFGINTQVQRAQQLVSSYRIDSVPTMAIAGRFLTSAAMAGSHEAALKVVDSLIERVRKGE